jgi:hypothetical protein
MRFEGLSVGIVLFSVFWDYITILILIFLIKD